MTDFYGRGVGKYHRKGLARGISAERQSAATFHYRDGIEPFQSYMEGVKVIVQQLGLPLYIYQAALSYAKQIYGFCRKYPDEMWAGLAGRAAAQWTVCGLSVDQLVQVAEASFTTQGFAGGSPDSAKVREVIEHEVANGNVGKSMKEGRDMESGEVSGQSDELRVTSDELREGTKDEPVLVLKPSELAAKMQEFLATKLENPADAEPFAKDIAEAVVQGAKPAAAPARHKPLRRGKPAPSELSVAGVTGQSTPLERFTKLGATGALRAALSGHQEVVKFVVAGRLCARKTFDELAQEYGLTKDEVLDIMTRMRVWVRRFTTYFENDWYWKDGMGKYFIPEPPMVEPRRPNPGTAA
jgi:hypothetical protein